MHFRVGRFGQIRVGRFNSPALNCLGWELKMVHFVLTKASGPCDGKDKRKALEGCALLSTARLTL